MSRPKKKPFYDSEKIMKELMEAVTEVYQETGEIKATAKEFSLSELKIRKLLITAGAYENDISQEILELHSAGKTVQEIEAIMGLKKSSINGYLPYSKFPYKPVELGTHAERTKLYRERKEIVQKLQSEKSEEVLWEAIVLFRNYPFFTSTGLPFSYILKRGKDGSYNKELLVDRRKNSKSLAWSSMLMAYRNSLVFWGSVVRRPKELGDIRGISYIYPILFRLGIIKVPDHVSSKMGIQNDRFCSLRAE